MENKELLKLKSLDNNFGKAWNKLSVKKYGAKG